LKSPDRRLLSPDSPRSWKKISQQSPLTVEGDVDDTGAAAKKKPRNRPVICCARSSVDPRQAEKLADLADQNIDWADVLALAQLHGLLPLLQSPSPRRGVRSSCRSRSTGMRRSLERPHALLLTSNLLENL